MTITNAIDLKFDCGAYLPYFVLAFSFLIGAVVFADQKVKGWIKIVLYLVNSFIIFAMASGTNVIGVKATGDEKEKEEIKATIKPIGLNHSIDPRRTVEYRFVQQQPQPNVEDPLKTKRNILQSQITSCSANIQLIQDDLVTNQTKYDNPKGKFGVLQRINASLIGVNELIKADTLLTREANYQAEIMDIQDNLQTLQNSLLLERRKPQVTKKFFKSWFN